MEVLNGKWRTFIFIYLLVWFVGSFWAIAVLRSGSVQGKLLGIEMQLLREYMYFGLAGAIGGSLYGLRAFHQYYDSLTMQFVYWYLMRPVVCIGCAIMTILLFDSGILLMKLSEVPVAKISIAFLSGFGYGKFMEKIKALTETLFSGEGDSPGGGGGSGGGGGGGGSGNGGGAGDNMRTRSSGRTVANRNRDAEGSGADERGGGKDSVAGTGKKK